MNRNQDKGYWRRWSAVVKAHDLKRLPKEQLDEQRRGITLEVTKGRTSAHLDLIDNKEITRLFRMLEFKAKPNCLNAAYPVANPEVEAEKDDQRRTVFAMSNKGLTSKEIEDIAEPLCRKHHVDTWKLLPAAVLKEMLIWKQFQPDQIAARQRRHVEAPFVYHLDQAR